MTIRNRSAFDSTIPRGHGVLALVDAPEGDPSYHGLSHLDLVTPLGLEVLTNGPMAGQRDHAGEPHPAGRLSLDTVLGDTQRVHLATEFGP